MVTEKQAPFLKYVAEFQAVSSRGRLGTCNFLHGVAENQAHFLKERQMQQNKG
jgi:hypothetical protein